jgi:hypothetical protein
VEYEYLYGNTLLSSDRWGFPLFDCSSSNWAYEVKSRYRVGSKVVVYVDPESGIAVLEPSLLFSWLVTLLGLGSATLIWIIRPKTTNRTD